MDEVKTKVDSLSKELESLYTARRLTQNLNDTLKRTCSLLEATTRAVHPWTERRFKRFQWMLIASWVVNSILFGIILFFLLQK